MRYLKYTLVILLVGLSLLTTSGDISAQGPILTCSGVGSGGDRADLRGIRFTVDQDFSAVEVRLAGRTAGVYVFEAELRRSTGFLGAADFQKEVRAFLPDSDTGTPYQSVLIDFDRVSVSGAETFTLKFVEKSAPDLLFFEVFGIGNTPCPDVEETDENDVAAPTIRGDPAGFKVLPFTGVLAINSTYVETPPTIDGVVTSGEWQISNQLSFGHGFVTILNDGVRLYILVDVLEDTVNDSSSPGDFFWLSFDVNKDNAITSNVDLLYGLEPGTGNMRYSYYLGPGRWTGLQPETRSSKAAGFGCFFADGSLTFSFPFNITCSRHRVWEFGLDLAELDAQAGDTVEMGLRVSSPTPSFTDDLPANFSNDFTNLIQVSLAPLPTPLPPANPNASLDFETEALEMTQAIQTRTNALPLIAAKQTVARLYVDVDDVGDEQPAIVYLYGAKAGVDLPGSPLAMLTTAPPAINRADLADAANFRLPGSWADAGTVEFQGRIRDLFGNESLSTPVNLSFTAKETPVYWVVPINTGTAGTPNLVSNAEIARQQSYLQTAYPVPQVRFVRKNWQVVGPTTVGNTINELNDYYTGTLLSWVLSIIFTGNAPFDLPDQIYGFTPSGGGISDPIWTGGRGRVSRGFRGTSREATMAHEINHNLDRSIIGTWGRHAPFGCGAGGPDPAWPYANDDIQQVGFDTRLPWVDGGGIQDTVMATNYPDFMSYCQSDDLAGNPFGQLPTKWISPYRWQNLFSSFSAASTLDAARVRNDVQPVYYISGQVNLDGTGRLNPILVQPGLPTEEIARGDYAIEVQDAAGNTLSETPFFVSFINVEGEQVETVTFNFQLPEQAGASKILLKHGDQILDEIIVSANPPAVTVLEPNGGEVWDGRHPVRWSAADADGDSLRFTILYSPDDGNIWFPVAANVAGNSYEVDTLILPASQTARMRVIATDGFHTVEDDSDETFTVVGGTAGASINFPLDNAEFASGETIFFAGEAANAEGASLPDESYLWSYDSTFLGMGRETSAVLPDGVHEVALTVVDENEKTMTDTITLFVGVAAPQNGVIEIRKEASGDTTTVFEFTFEDEPFTLTGGQSTTFDQLAANGYRIVETVPDGWQVGRIACDNGVSLTGNDVSEVAVELQPGENVVCTFTNEPQTAGQNIYLPIIIK